MLFHPDNPHKSPAHERLYARYAIAFTVVDFTAALMFVIGSIFFFWPSTTTFATWLFLIGSICFGLKPTIRLRREIRLLRLDDYADLARDDTPA